MNIGHWTYEVTSCLDCQRANRICPKHAMQRIRVISEVERDQEIANAAYTAGYEAGKEDANCRYKPKNSKQQTLF